METKGRSFTQKSYRVFSFNLDFLREYIGFQGMDFTLRPAVAAESRGTAGLGSVVGVEVYVRGRRPGGVEVYARVGSIAGAKFYVRGRETGEAEVYARVESVVDAF